MLTIQNSLNVIVIFYSTMPSLLGNVFPCLACILDLVMAVFLGKPTDPQKERQKLIQKLEFSM